MNNVREMRRQAKDILNTAEFYGSVLEEMYDDDSPTKETMQNMQREVEWIMQSMKDILCSLVRVQRWDFVHKMITVLAILSLAYTTHVTLHPGKDKYAKAIKGLACSAALVGLGRASGKRKLACTELLCEQMLDLTKKLNEANQDNKQNQGR